MFLSTISLLTIISHPSLAPRNSADELPRRGTLGVGFAPVSADVRTALKLKAGEGLVAQAPMPGLSAEKAGLQAGDVIVSLNGKPAVAGGLGEMVRALPSGQTFTLKGFRDGKPTEWKAVLMEKPRDPGNENYTVSYSHIVSNGKRMRTIITTPKAPGKHPGWMFIQGLSPISYDYTLNAGGASLARIDAPILFDYANSGFVTMRVEKPGVGDSEGGPFSECDYTTELDIYRQAMKQLKEQPSVDASNVFIFGHSMGGAFGPMIACETPVRGIAVYGTAARTWYEYLLDTLRYQGIVMGGSYESADEEVRQGTRIMGLIFMEGKSVESVKKDHPELAATIDSLFPGGLFNGKSPKFWSQLASTNFATYWAKCNCPVLAVHGASDFVSYEADHRLIADIVNKVHPGAGTFATAANNDHLFNSWATEQESAKNWPNGTYGETFQKLMKSWIQDILNKPGK